MAFSQAARKDIVLALMRRAYSARIIEHVLAEHEVAFDACFAATTQEMRVSHALLSEEAPDSVRSMRSFRLYAGSLPGLPDTTYVHLNPENLASDIVNAMTKNLVKRSQTWNTISTSSVVDTSELRKRANTLPTSFINLSDERINKHLRRAKNKALVKRLVDVTDARSELIKEVKEDGNRVMGILSNAKSQKALYDAWPEIKPLIDKVLPEQNTGTALTVPRDAFNTKFDLPPGRSQPSNSSQLKRRCIMCRHPPDVAVFETPDHELMRVRGQERYRRWRRSRQWRGSHAEYLQWLATMWSLYEVHDVEEPFNDFIINRPNA